MPETAQFNTEEQTKPPEAAPAAPEEPDYGWSIREAPQFENKVVEAQVEPEAYVSAVQTADFPDSEAESNSYESLLLNETEIAALEDTTPEPLMDEARRKNMLGEKIPKEWIDTYGADAAQRLRLLSKKIEKLPDAPVNFVLRGELYLAAGETEKAAADFQKAITLAEQLDPELDWGYINTAYIDRAIKGLRQITN